MDLRPDPVVLVLHDVRRRESLPDFVELQHGRREHHADRREVREGRLGERVVARAKRCLPDVAGEHVGATDPVAVAPERARDRLLQETLAQPDPGLAGDDLHDVAGLAGVRPRQEGPEQIAFRPDTAGRGDRAERLRHIRKREAIAPRGALTDELGCDVAKIGVPLV